MVEPTGVKRKLAVILAADAEGILARLWRGWRRALFFVQPRTVILWQRTLWGVVLVRQYKFVAIMQLREALIGGRADAKIN